jgi:L-aspartate oxidase
VSPDAPLGHAAVGDRGVGVLDVLVIGSGVAGLSVAVRLGGGMSGGPPASKVGVLTKGELWQSATRWAQGGVAAVLGGDEDSTDLHLADTLAAGAGLCDIDAVRVLVDEGPARVEELVALGVEFDREASGGLSLAREGGHSQARVVHAGGAATGAEVERALVEATWRTASAVLERWFALDLLVTGGRCRGVVARRPDGEIVTVEARHVVLATGGAGQLFSVTTNPLEATGDGVAMALRAGAPVADTEFIQFHPTALHHPAMPRPLLSEALRGHGALLRDDTGERFVDELAPRDVVSRAMASRMSEHGVDHLWLDATGLADFDERFPNIAASLAEAGLDASRDWLPIAPAAHHLSGGVLTDLWGASLVPGLWAAGEVACTGVHGANRLASNSLLEGMVFGARLAEALGDGRDGPTPTGVVQPLLDPERRRGSIPVRPIAADGAGAASTARPSKLEVGRALPDLGKLRERLQRAMTTGAGVVRSAESLAAAAGVLEEIWTELADPPSVPADEAVAMGELVNLASLGRAVVSAAATRRESRGAHTRSDFPETDPAWRCRLALGSL